MKITYTLTKTEIRDLQEPLREFMERTEALYREGAATLPHLTGIARIFETIVEARDNIDPVEKDED